MTSRHGFLHAARMTTSRSALRVSLFEAAYQPINPRKFPSQGAFNTHRRPVPVGNFAHMLATEVQRTRDPAENALAKFFSIDRGGHIFCERGNVSRCGVPVAKSTYLDADISVKKKMRVQVEPEVRLPLGDNIYQLRKARGLTQTQLAEILGVRQSAVARWETSKDKPLPQTLLKLSELVGEKERQWWRDQAADLAGFGESTVSPLPEVSLSRTIPLIKTHSMVGSLGAVNPLDVELNLSLPAEWFPESGSIRAARINGNSISPLVEGTYIAVIDISRRDADRLVGCMVAIQTTKGIDARWLRRDGATYLLVPLRESSDNPIRVLRHRGENSIVGQVVKWIGDAPQVKFKH